MKNIAFESSKPPSPGASNAHIPARVPGPILGAGSFFKVLSIRGVAPRRWIAALAVLAGLLAALCAPAPARAEAAPETPPYVVQPGDALADIARRAGTDPWTLQQLNGLQDPRHLYPGQRLRLPQPAAVLSWQPRDLALGESLYLLARRAGWHTAPAFDWRALAEANRILHPGALVPGQEVYAPPLAATRVLTATGARPALAARHGVPLWQALRLNPQPLYAGAPAVLPGTEPPASPLPAPLVALTLAPQPLARGQSAVVAVQTAVTATCEVAYLNVVEPCYARDATHLYALLGFPALLEPGPYGVVLRVHAEGASTALPLTLLVTAGRYDYERIDLPPDRQSLLDPALSQAEREKIAALRTLRTPERWWEYPLRWPVDASVTSYYGSRRSYGYGFNSYHGGTDFRAEKGAPVLAPASGVVVLAEPLVVRGNAVLIDHGWGVVSGYWHLSRIDVAVGQRVAQGEVIGGIGNTGLSTGPHLHWELWVNGVSVSPLQWVTEFAPSLGGAVP